MHWTAPTSKDTAAATLEKRLWEAADELRANSGLTSAQYSQPVLGLIFLRFADARFAARRAELEKATSSRRGSRVDEPGAYHAAGVLYLPAEARFGELLEYPEGGKKGVSLGQAVDGAMRAVERENAQLAGVLPKTYQMFNARLLKELLKTFSTIPLDLEGDTFGKIYEYFLSEFAMSEGRMGGEFYTPTSIVQLLVEILEPFQGRILDPACGSGGMFVQSARFAANHKQGVRGLSIYGVESVDDTGRLCRMNLAVHGLEGDVRHGGNVNSYYDDPHNLVGRFDFVLANPPFNVDKVDKDRIKDAVWAGRRFPFGIPKADNANYLWIQLFYAALNASGRAGFVMAPSAGDARGTEMEIRKSLIEAQAVDAVVAVGPNMFYTVTLPCMLWFLDRGKVGTTRAEQVLFLDARHVFRQIDRAHRDWTPAQIGFLANVVRLYRRQDVDPTFGGDEAKAKLQEVFGEEPKYADVAGLCKAATRNEIEEQGWSLNPRRYVGVAPGEEVGDEAVRPTIASAGGRCETSGVITSVSINNLRGIREGALEGLTPLTVLVGPNSSGKSTVLDALLIGASRQPAASAGYVIRRRPGLRHGARWLLWRAQSENAATVQLELASGGRRTARVTWSDDTVSSELRRRLAEQGSEGPYSSVEVDVTTNPPGDEVRGQSVIAEDNAYRANDAAFADAPAPTATWLVDPRLGTPLAELYSRIAERGRRQSVRDLIASVVDGVEAIEILTERNDPRLHLTFADYSVPVALAGDGVQALVRLSLELAARPEGTGTVLLEEPEAHQHPAAIYASAKAIVEAVRRGLQVVLTTHDLDLIDALVGALKPDELGMLSVYRLVLEHGVLRHSRLDGEHVRFARREIEDDLR